MAVGAMVGRAEPYTQTLPSGRRDAIRAKALAEAPSWYNPWAHLAFPSLIGIAAIATSLSLLRDPGWPEVGFAIFVWLVSNASEWRIHKHILHRRSFPLQVLFDRHTPEHHAIYLRHDMAMRSRPEFRLVLIPSYGIVAIFLSTCPVPLALWTTGYANLAAVYVATTMAYVVSYEWLHLAYHLPADSVVGRLRLIGILRNHHARHHTPELMQKWNFNVTVPVMDWVMGTIYRGA